MSYPFDTLRDVSPVPGVKRWLQPWLLALLLALLPVHDVSAPTFTLIYGSIAATLAFLWPRPQLLLRALCDPALSWRKRCPLSALPLW